jgi:cell division protein FtsL
MRRKNKEINIFSMSALDLFASAMGVFILIAVVALPYYLKTDQQLMTQSRELQKENETLNNTLNSVQNELNACKAESTSQARIIEQLKQQLAQSENDQSKCEEQLKQVFIAVVIQWPEEKIDIDLHVFTPNGDEYFFDRHNRTGRDYPGSNARLSRDTTRGPGVEVWEIPTAMPGKYKVYYDFYSQNGGVSRALITGMIYTNKGNHSLPDISLGPRQNKLVATITITPEGGVVID